MQMVFLSDLEIKSANMYKKSQIHWNFILSIFQDENCLFFNKSIFSKWKVIFRDTFDISPHHHIDQDYVSVASLSTINLKRSYKIIVKFGSCSRNYERSPKFCHFCSWWLLLNFTLVSCVPPLKSILNVFLCFLSRFFHSDIALLFVSGEEAYPITLIPPPPLLLH